jgi:hypothetical protein
MYTYSTERCTLILQRDVHLFYREIYPYSIERDRELLTYPQRYLPQWSLCPTEVSPTVVSIYVRTQSLSRERGHIPQRYLCMYVRSPSLENADISHRGIYVCTYAVPLSRTRTFIRMCAECMYAFSRIYIHMCVICMYASYVRCIFMYAL